MKTFVVKIKAIPEDFCESDLLEAIKDGIENVGNYKIKNIKVELKWKLNV